ncbi:MAG: toxin-antitoxin system antitoxin subunit, partial [Pseudomonadota bacterium]
MRDEIIAENLQLISESLDLIARRFANISQPDDLVLDDNGVTILDSIAMRLQVVGELLKKIDKQDRFF